MGLFTLRLDEVFELMGGESVFVEKALSQYPIFEADHRPVLNRKIIDHYLMREIGYETLDLFLAGIRRKLNEIMPVYNDLYYSKSLLIDPLHTFNYSTIVDGLSSVENRSEMNSTTHTATSAKSQTSVTNKQFPSTMLTNGDYADTGSWTEAEQSGEDNSGADSVSSNVGTDKTDSTTRVVGQSGSPSELISQYRSLIINIDMLIVSELSQCFMLIDSTGNRRDARIVSVFTAGSVPHYGSATYAGYSY